MRLPESFLRDLFGSQGPNETQASLLDALGIDRACFEAEGSQLGGDDDDGVDDAAVDADAAALLLVAARVAALTDDDAPFLPPSDRRRAVLLEPLALGVRLEAGAVARLLECCRRRTKRRKRRKRRRRGKQGGTADASAAAAAAAAAADDDDSFGSLLEKVAVEASERLAPPPSSLSEDGEAAESASDAATEAASSLVAWARGESSSSKSSSSSSSAAAAVSFDAKCWRRRRRKQQQEQSDLALPHLPLPLLLRGAAADRDIPAGEPIARIPLNLLIHSRMVASTEAGAALAALDLGEEETLLAFTLLDAADEESPRESIWRALKEKEGEGEGERFLFSSLRSTTAINASDEEIALLDEGTPARAVAERAAAHARAAADAAAPLLSSLCRAFGAQVRRELFPGVGSFSKEAYLWALALWYSYSIEVSFEEEDEEEEEEEKKKKTKTKKTVPCLAPPLFLLNHSPYPHCVSYRLEEEDEDDDDDEDDVEEEEKRKKSSPSRSLVARACRGARRGEQLFLSYGRLLSRSAAHSLCYYGFVVPSREDPDAALEVDLLDGVVGGREMKKKIKDDARLETKHFLRATPPAPPTAALEAAEAVSRVIRATTKGDGESEKKENAEGVAPSSAGQVLLRAAVASARAALERTAASAREALLQSSSSSSSSSLSSPFVRAILDYGESGVDLADRVMRSLGEE